MAKKQRWIVTTPVVTIGYNHLRTPDTKFDAEGDYKCDFFMDEAQAKAFCTAINKDARAGGKKVKYTKVDGQFKFKTKQSAIIRDKKSGEEYDMKPRLNYIVAGKTVAYPEDSPSPWSGSRAEIELEVVPYDTFGGGLTLRVRALRLHSIVEGKPQGNWAEVDEDYSSSSAERQDDEDVAGDDPLTDDEDESAGADEEEVW